MKRIFISIAAVVLFGTLSGVHAQTSVSAEGGSARTAASGLSAAQRNELILSVARQLRMRSPEVAPGIVPDSVNDETEIASILRKAIELDSSLAQGGSFCDSGFVGEPIAFSSTVTLRMDDLLTQIHRRFGVNFVLGAGVADLPVNIRTGNIPWNELLNSQLFLSGVRARCSGNTIQLVKNSDLPKLQDTAEVQTRFIKLKFLQPSSQSNVDVAGRSGGGSGGGGGGAGEKMGNFEKLIFEIEKILGIRAMTSSPTGSAGGGGGGGGGGASQQVTEVVRANRSVSQIPGRNILVVRGTDEELEVINEIIERADRPPFQVIVKGLVYTANENKALDLGIQSSIVASTAATRTNSAASTSTGSTGSTGTGSTTGTSTGAVPVRSAGIGYQVPQPGNLFDVLALIGTVDFNIQANALATKGIIAVKSRPFAMVLDGQEAELNIGRQIPVIIQAQNSTGGAPGSLDILEASNILNITPFVIDDDKGQPIGVNLGLRLEANDVDLSVTSQGVPSVNRQSIQTNLLLNQEKTVILGGFTVDSDSETRSKIPGLGDIPGLGWLFKRKVNSNQLNRLYFAISVTVVPFGTVVQPVDVPVSTDIPGTPIK